MNFACHIILIMIMRTISPNDHPRILFGTLQLLKDYGVFCIRHIWQAHVNEVEHVEDTLDMEPSASPEPGGTSGSGSPVSIPIRTDNILPAQ